MGVCEAGKDLEDDYFLKGPCKVSKSLWAYMSNFVRWTKTCYDIQFFTYHVSKDANEPGMKTLSIWWNAPIIAGGRVNWYDLSR